MYLQTGTNSLHRDTGGKSIIYKLLKTSREQKKAEKAAYPGQSL